MRTSRWLGAVLVALACGGGAVADVFHDYEDLAEGFLGETFVHAGVTYRDVNRVTGFFPDGNPFNDTELGNQVIIERAVPLYNDFPGFGSPNNGMTFGTVFVPGDNLSIGALASVWMDLDELSNAASLDIAFYENGPWGDIQFVLEAWNAGAPVGSTSYTLSNLGGRDNPAVQTLAIDGVEFDSLHLYGWLNGNYTAPRGLIDDLTVIAVPEPAALALVALGLALVRRR